MQTHKFIRSNKILAFLAMVTLFFICGCSTVSTTGKVFEPIDMVSTDSSILYIYRPTREFNMYGWVELFINDEKKFGLIDNSYGYIILNEGEYNIRAEGSMFGTNWWPGPATATISIAAGQEYYVRIIPMPPETTTDVPTSVQSSASLAITSFSDNSKAQTEIREIEKSQAIDEIAETILVEQ